MPPNRLTLQGVPAEQKSTVTPPWMDPRPIIVMNQLKMPISLHFRYSDDGMDPVLIVHEVDDERW